MSENLEFSCSKYADRSPEVLLGIPYNGAIDMWSLACVCSEMYLGLPLFPGVSQHNQLTRIIEMMGNPPDALVEGKNGLKYFTRVTSPEIVNTGIMGYMMDQYTADSYNKKKTKASLLTPQDMSKPSKFRLKTADEYAIETNTEKPVLRKYLRYNKLEEVIMKCPLANKTKLTPEQKKEEMLRRLCFLNFLQGIFRMNPFERWTAKQAASHPFITNELFTGEFIPPIDQKMNERKLAYLVLTQENDGRKRTNNNMLNMNNNNNNVNNPTKHLAVADPSREFIPLQFRRQSEPMGFPVMSSSPNSSSLLQRHYQQQNEQLKQSNLHNKNNYMSTFDQQTNNSKMNYDSNWKPLQRGMSVISGSDHTVFNSQSLPHYGMLTRAQQDERNIQHQMMMEYNAQQDAQFQHMQYSAYSAEPTTSYMDKYLGETTPIQATTQSTQQATFGGLHRSFGSCDELFATAADMYSGPPSGQVFSPTDSLGGSAVNSVANSINNSNEIGFGHLLRQQKSGWASGQSTTPQQGNSSVSSSLNSRTPLSQIPPFINKRSGNTPTVQGQLGLALMASASTPVSATSSTPTSASASLSTTSSAAAVGIKKLQSNSLPITTGKLQDSSSQPLSWSDSDSDQMMASSMGDISSSVSDMPGVMTDFYHALVRPEKHEIRMMQSVQQPQSKTGVTGVVISPLLSSGPNYRQQPKQSQQQQQSQQSKQLQQQNNQNPQRFQHEDSNDLNYRHHGPTMSKSSPMAKSESNIAHHYKQYYEEQRQMQIEQEKIHYLEQQQQANQYVSYQENGSTYNQQHQYGSQFEYNNGHPLTFLDTPRTSYTNEVSSRHPGDSQYMGSEIGTKGNTQEEIDLVKYYESDDYQRHQVANKSPSSLLRNSSREIDNINKLVVNEHLAIRQGKHSKYGYAVDDDEEEEGEEHQSTSPRNYSVNLLVRTISNQSTCSPLGDNTTGMPLTNGSQGTHYNGINKSISHSTSPSIGDGMTSPLMTSTRSPYSESTKPPRSTTNPSHQMLPTPPRLPRGVIEGEGEVSSALSNWDPFYGVPETDGMEGGNGSTASIKGVVNRNENNQSTSVESSNSSLDADNWRSAGNSRSSSVDIGELEKNWK